MRIKHFVDNPTWSKYAIIHFVKLYILVIGKSAINSHNIIAYEKRKYPRECVYTIQKNCNQKKLFTRRKLKDSQFNKLCFKIFISRK